jgi:hypothetical protein
MGTQLAGLKQEDMGGFAMSRPTWPKDLGQESHCLRRFMRYLIDKSCKIDK